MKYHITIPRGTAAYVQGREDYGSDILCDCPYPKGSGGGRRTDW